jgi:pimeloyl-ACP methyl ester carboxylesterase
MAFHGGGAPQWATGDVMRQQFHLNEHSPEVDLYTPDSPRQMSPLGAGWPVTDELDAEIVSMAEGYENVIGLGYSSGGLFLTGLALRNPDLFSAVAVFAGGIMARDAWRVTSSGTATRFLFIHSPKDTVIGFNGGVTPVNVGGQIESYLGPVQSLNLLQQNEGADGPGVPFDLIDPSADGWLEGWAAGDRFDGAETVRYSYGATVHGDELWSIEPARGYGHVDYVGRSASHKIVEWLREGFES